MRFMILVKANKNWEAGVLPDEKLLTEMGKYNEELAKAGGPNSRPSFGSKKSEYARKRSN